ncbi:MAG: protoporphyrinogen oxidase [Candidatus Omnitrophota bacterium]
MKKIAIIGGGISGLAVLHYLKRRYKDTVEITLYERNPYVGGAIASLYAQGFLFETGPNAFLTNQPNTLVFIEELGFTDQVIEANHDSKRRYIQLGGKLHLLPMDPINFIKSPLLSTDEKFRLIQGLFIKNLPKDQSVYDYTSKRFGVAVSERLVDPFLTGIYAGNIKRLNMSCIFPKKSTSKGQKKVKTQLCSFKDGMGSFIKHISKQYKPFIKTGVEVKSLDQLKVDQIICSTPAHVASSLLGMDILKNILYSPIAVVGLVINNDTFNSIPDGFGYLIPSSEGKEVLGALIENNTFKRQSPEGKMFIRVMLGGAHHPEIINNKADEIVVKAIKEIDSIYGLKEKPQSASVKLWAKGIPQYELGYPAIRQTIKDELQKRPNLHLCANYLDGISFNDCIKNARELVEAINI